MRKTGDENSGLRRRVKSALFPIFVAATVFTVYPTIISYQDVASLASPSANLSIVERWLAYIPQAAGISQRMPYSKASAAGTVDLVTTGSLTPAIAPKSLKSDAARIIFGVKTVAVPQKVNRALKGSRVVSSTVQRPPAQFSAGSIIERHSMLETLNVGKNLELSFVKAKPAAEAFQVASTFQAKMPPASETIRTDLPVMVARLVNESKSNILGYNQEPKLKRSPFAAILNDDEPISLVPRLSKNDHQWAKSPLPLNSHSQKQQQCLATGIYFEARGEPVRGQAAVAQVILNRVRNPAYPNSICGVVYQNKNWRNKCQFSFACDRVKDRVNDAERWEVAEYVARETTKGSIWLKEVGSSTHYHAVYVRPGWASAMKRVGRIGLHVFYRTFGGGWS